MNNKKNSAPNLTQLVREEIAKNKKIEEERIRKSAEEEIKKAVENTKENFKKMINSIDESFKPMAFYEVFNPVRFPYYKNSSSEIAGYYSTFKMDYKILMQECFSSLSKEEGKKFLDALFSKKNENIRKALCREINNGKSLNSLEIPLDVKFLNDKNITNSMGDTGFEIIAKNRNSYLMDLENYRPMYAEMDTSELKPYQRKSFSGVFSLSVDSEFSNYLLEKYAKTYDVNDKNHESTKVLDFAMENMGKAVKNEFSKRIESSKSEGLAK